MEPAEFALASPGSPHSAPPGTPHSVRVSDHGATVLFLRSDRDEPDPRLWAFDVASGQERLLFGDPVARFATCGRSLALITDGRLAVGGLDAPIRLAEVPGPVTDPRPDPSGRWVAYLSDGALHTLDRGTGATSMLAGEENRYVTWGAADYVTRTQFQRQRGYWWSPDGESILAARVDTTRVGPGRPYPIAGAPNAEVSLHVLDLDGGWVDVHWDRETYPYLTSVAWSDVGGPLVTVLRRGQQHGLVLAVDPRTGETQVHAELADPRWVGPVPGTPCYLPDGRVLIGGELAHDGYDARCLFADGGLLTPPLLYVRRVCGRLGAELLIEASEGEPSEQHLYRVATRSVATAADVTRVTADAGWHVGACGGETLAIGASSLNHDGTEWTIMARGVTVGRLSPGPGSASGSSGLGPGAPRPALERVTDRRLPAGVLYPRHHVSGRLPVLVDGPAAPGRQSVVAARSAWLVRQWWADQGFAVVVIDSRGMPGVSPSFEKVIHRRLADVMLTDQADALHALAEKHPDLDLSRVAFRGRGFGGWLAALAVLRRPETYHCAVATDPFTDWHLRATAEAERYLGRPSDASDVYAHNSLLEPASEPVRRRADARPLLIINTVSADSAEPATDSDDRPELGAETGRLVAALTAAARPFAVATGADPVAELDFLRHHLA